MLMHHNLLPVEAGRPNAFQSAFNFLARRIADWITTAANYYEAAAIYEQLSRLSDAELKRRGLSRGTLARDICQVCERTRD